MFTTQRKLEDKLDSIVGNMKTTIESVIGKLLGSGNGEDDGDVLISDDKELADIKDEA